MTIALPSDPNHPKLAHKSSSSSQNYSLFDTTTTLPHPDLQVEPRDGSMTFRVSRVEGSSRISPHSSVGGHLYHTECHQQNNCDQSHPPNNPQIVIPKRRWAVGTMLMFVLFVLSLSTSPAACVSLGSSGSRLELTSNPLEERGGQSGGMSSSARLEEGEESQRNYMIEPQGQLYLPSLLQQTSGRGRDINHPLQRQGVEDFKGGRGTIGHSTVAEQARYSLQNRQQVPQNEDDSSRAGWETVIDPHLYLLTEWNSSPDQQQRMRRNVGPSLSIVNPLDVLRQRLLLEIARRKMRQSHNQIMANAEILKNIGRRRRR